MLTNHEVIYIYQLPQKPLSEALVELINDSKDGTKKKNRYPSCVVYTWF